MTEIDAAPLFERLRQMTAGVHRRTLEHPTVRGIGAGDLPDEIFRYYLEQDYQFLLRFVRVLALSASAAPDLESMAQLSRLVTSTVVVEIDALRALYVRFGGDAGQLEAVEPAPTCEAYCNHLAASAHQGDLLVCLAATLPCHWGYHDIGLRLRAAGLPADERYAAWIEEYASDAYGELVDWAIERFNALGRRARDERLAAARRAFDLSSRYEYGFWEMAWRQETWPAGVISPSCGTAPV